MVDVHSATAEIRRRKKEERRKRRKKKKKKPHGKNIMSASATQGGQNNLLHTDSRRCLAVVR